MAETKIRWNVVTDVAKANLKTALDNMTDSTYSVYQVVHDGANYTIIAWKKEQV